MRASARANRSKLSLSLSVHLKKLIHRTCELPFHPFIVYSVNASIYAVYKACILCTPSECMVRDQTLVVPMSDAIGLYKNTLHSFIQIAILVDFDMPVSIYKSA